MFVRSYSRVSGIKALRLARSLSTSTVISGLVRNTGSQAASTASRPIHASSRWPAYPRHFPNSQSRSFSSTIKNPQQPTAPDNDSSKGLPPKPSEQLDASAIDQSHGVVTMEIGGMEENYPFIFKLVQAILESTHDRTLFSSNTKLPTALAPTDLAAPWWAVIAGSAIVLRTCLTLPLFIHQQRAGLRAQNLSKVTATWQHSMRSSLKLELAGKTLSEEEFEKKLRQRLKIKHHDLMLKQGCHPILNLLLPLAQLPIWLSMTCILRHLCGIPLPYFEQADAPIPTAAGMSSEGILWFADLAAADPTHALPVITGCLYMANVLLSRSMSKKHPPPSISGTSTGPQKPSLLSKTATCVAFGSPFLMTYIALGQPSSIVFYWAVSAVFSLLQNLVFQLPQLRRLLKFPLKSKGQ